MSEWVVQPISTSPIARAQEAWRSSGLLRFFAHEALHRFTKQTIAGRLWLVVRPLMAVVVHVVFFGLVLRVHPGDTPYPIFYLSAMILWYSFDQAVTWSSRSIELNARLVSKIYVPKLILPIAFMAPALVDFLVLSSFLLLVIGAFWVGSGQLYLVFGAQLMWLPVLIAIAAMLALAIAMWTAPLAAMSRDVVFSLRYVLQGWFLLTPVAYPEAAVTGGLKWLLVANPMAPLVIGFRNALLGQPVDAFSLLPPLLCAALLLGTGFLNFVARDARLADRI
jgi:lipopolysaccharide transport system permease protein